MSGSYFMFESNSLIKYIQLNFTQKFISLSIDKYSAFFSKGVQ